MSLALAPMVAAQQGSQPSASKKAKPWLVDVEVGSALSIALPAFETKSLRASTTAHELTEIVRSDIEFASLYRVVNQDRYPKQRRQEDGRPNFYGWEAGGADVLVTAEVSETVNRTTVAVRIYSVKDEKLAFGTEYKAPPNLARSLAHRLADDILEISGLQGVAQTTIAYAGRAPGSQFKQIHMMDYDGFGQKVLINQDSLAIQPRWSPDGTTLSFISFSRRNPDLVLAKLTEGSVIALDPGKGMTFSSDWSPDGKRLAIASTRDGNSEIYVMDANGANVQRLTHHPSIDVSPTWSPTGKEIAFTSNRTGSPQIYVMDEEGLNLRRISLKGSYNSAPAWSPSREYSEIAYASRIDGVFDIVVQDLAPGGNVRMLTTKRGINESPSWSPNGRYLAFSSTRTGSSQIYIMNRDGSNQKQLTFEGENTSPSWRARAQRD